MRPFRNIRLIALLAITAAACLERYDPPKVTNTFGFLVVEGFVSLNGTVNVRLSRTNALSDPATPPPETGAIVVLEQRGIRNFTVPERSPGNYSLTGVAINAASEYRLRIRARARDHTSDYVKLLKSPPIENVWWEPQPDGIQVYVSSRDPEKKTRFYHWNYVETWQHNANYLAGYYWLNGRAVSLPLEQAPFTCWSTELSSNILIHSTEQLGEDIVTKFPLTFIPRESLKISSINGMYSILLQQNAMDKAAYQFWQQLQKTTEDLGGLFDPQPFQVVGNIHGPANSTEPVLGYFSGGEIAEKRIFIDPKDFPDYLRVNRSGLCPIMPLEPGPGQSLADFLASLNNGLLLIDDSPLSTAPGACIDCRVDGGTTTKPSFWP